MATKKKTAEKKTAEKKTAKKKTAEKKTAEKKTAEKKTAEKKTAEKKTAEKKTAEKKTAKKKTAKKVVFEVEKMGSNVWLKISFERSPSWLFNGRFGSVKMGGRGGFETEADARNAIEHLGRVAPGAELVGKYTG